jgi:L-ascorbate metabolism protein UlaG (beta-lactamase superfamily)
VTGAELIQDINSCRLRPMQCALWWLGQHGFVVKLGDTVLYVDPFLSDLAGRQVAPLLTPSQVTNARLVLGSHDHADHIDRPAWPVLAAGSPQAEFIVPELVRERIVSALRLPSRRVIGLDEDRPAEVEGVKISAVPAAHEFLDTDPVTGLHPYLGFILEGNGFRLYHAGDCCLYEGLYERLHHRRFDLMILPINGRDARRLRSDCIGNMTYQEAADLAGAMKPGAVIPAHYEMFAMNSADANDFADYLQVKYPHQRCLVPRHGQRVVLDARPQQAAP